MQKIITPGGETLVILPLADYEALVDAADIAAAKAVLADIAAGRDELVPSELVDRILNGENRVRVWREYRGLSSKAVAEKAEISPGYYSEIEGGSKAGSLEAMGRIAKALNLKIDDLIP